MDLERLDRKRFVNFLERVYNFGKGFNLEIFWNGFRIPAIVLKNENFNAGKEVERKYFNAPLSKKTPNI